MLASVGEILMNLLMILVWVDQSDDGVRDAAAVYDADQVRQHSRGHWLAILSRLAPELAPAIQRLGRHVPCPVHGGKDGFRLFRDAPETGGGICNSCGVPGFQISWSVSETPPDQET